MIPFSVVDHVFFRVHPSLDGGKNLGKICGFLDQKQLLWVVFQPKVVHITSEEGY
jgi:hypothetical protein